MKISILFGITLIGTLICALATATEQKYSSHASASTVPDFTALNDQAASKLADDLVADHFALEQKLTSQLDSPRTPTKRKVLLIYTLGRMRSRWAVASLVKIVDFKSPFSEPRVDIARWGPHPVVDALTNIGDVYSILQMLPEETNPERIQLLLTVIYQVEGAKPGQAWLEKALASASDDATKQKLQGLIKEYQTMVSRMGK